MKRLNYRNSCLTLCGQSVVLAIYGAGAAIIVCYQVKTDSAEQSLSIDFSRCQREDKNFSRLAIVWQGLIHASAARDLWRLAWSSRRAAAGLAVALTNSAERETTNQDSRSNRRG